MNLATKTKYVNIVIRVKNYIPNVTKITEWCASNCELYAFIVHDKDINITGELIPSHAHLVLTLNTSKRLSTTLNDITKYLGICTTGVEIDKTTSLDGSIQYLLHKNEPKKYHYDIKNIISNIKEDELQALLDSNVSSNNFETWYQICLDSVTLLEVIKKVGVSVYNQYYKVIRDIWFETCRMKINPFN